MIVSDAPQISVVVTTYQRRDLLMECLTRLDRQCLRLDVIVVDDGSTDGSAAAVRARWPQLRVIVNDSGTPRRPAMQRHAGYAACRCRIVASIDEDLHLNANDSLSRWLGGFDDPRVAIVAIPFRDVALDTDIRQAAPDAEGSWQRHTHIPCGALIDLDKYRAVGGYAAWIEGHRAAEDLALRLLAAGFVVRLVPPDRIAAHWRRSNAIAAEARSAAARNDLLFYWRHTPLSLLVPFLLLTALRNLRDGWRERALLARLRGLLSAPLQGWRQRLARRPVPSAVFKRFRLLKAGGPRPLDPHATPIGRPSRPLSATDWPRAAEPVMLRPAPLAVRRVGARAAGT